MTDDKRYFRTEIPNIIDDLGLDPHERALYVHYKRSCGGDDCEWTESVRITAQRTKMSHTRASQARAALVKRGLITVTGKGNDGTAVRIVDVWTLNNAYYGYKDGRPNIDGWTIQQLEEWVKGVNIIYTQEPRGANGPVGVNNMNTSVNNIYNKKEPLEVLSKDNGAKAPTAKPGKKGTDKTGPRWQLMNEFLDDTGLTYPYRSSEQRFWWSGIGELYELASKDVDVGKKLIKAAVEKLRSDRMTINKPESIIATARAILAEKNHKPKVTLK